METFIWLAEAPASEKVGIPSDGGAFSRLCSKMATVPANHRDGDADRLAGCQ
jgi:hypothetical protein